MTATTATPVALSTEDFESALERYIDEFKPDPLSRQQLQGWKLQWEGKEDQEWVLPISDHPALTKYLSPPSRLLQGELQITGDHLVVSLEMNCAWSPLEPSDEEKLKPTKQHGTLYYACHAKAKFNDQVKSNMKKRLQDDSYIAKLLKGDGLLLAQASIHCTPTEMEERVHVPEITCEAVKRAVWSRAETPLDVVECVVQLPSLPQVLQNKDDNHTPLANRAKLRLLEDAMCDACEKEGEDTLLNDLNLEGENGQSTNSSNQQKKRQKR